jgi:phosphatidate cytidylyltransferase
VNISSANGALVVSLLRPHRDPVSNIDSISDLAAARARNFKRRVASAAVLAPITLGVAYMGGWSFILFWAVVAVIILWEWITLVARSSQKLTFFYYVWIAVGIVYAGLMLLVPVSLRADRDYGMAAIMFLFAIVWTTDVFAYFAGHAIGGPRLCPAISPKKTWSGALAGAIGAIIAGTGTMLIFGSSNWMAIAFMALFLSVTAQCGDLLESAIKRQFSAKDASHLIPGHGGVMDRVDSFWAAALAALLVGLARGGFDSPAQGLLVW